MIIYKKKNSFEFKNLELLLKKDDLLKFFHTFLPFLTTADNAGID